MTRNLFLAPQPQRLFSSRANRGYAIPAQGFVFSVLLLPVLVYGMYAGRYGPSDEDLERELRQRYAERIAETRQSNKNMGEFFQHTVFNPDGKFDDTMKELLYAGKGEKKRMHAVDEKLYGTHEGVEEKKRRAEEKKKRDEYRRKKKAGQATPEEKQPHQKTKETAKSPQPLPSNGGGLVVNAQSAAALGVVAALAAGVGFLAGGSRRS